MNEQSLQRREFGTQYEDPINDDVAVIEEEKDAKISGSSVSYESSRKENNKMEV